jgi:hypothetical protein
MIYIVRRKWVATIGKAMMLISLPVVLAWAGWVYGTAWHPTLVPVPCHFPPTAIRVGPPCAVRPFWTRADVLEAIGAVAGLVVVAITLIALRRSRPTSPDGLRTPQSEAHSA